MRYPLPVHLASLVTMVSRAIASWTARLSGIWLVAIAAVLLGGCVDYDVAIRFDSPNRGEVVQQIQVGERFATLSKDAVQQWISTIQQQAKRLGGQVEKPTRDGLVVRIPFNNSDELEQKFNQFFTAIAKPEPAQLADVTLPPIESNLSLEHSNFLLIERHHLRYQVDLRSLGVLSTEGNVLVSPGSLISLQFKLDTPWGARNIVRSDLFRSTVRQSGRSLIWTLAPGEQNQIETIFWMPNPLGIGSGVISLLVLIGRFLRSPHPLPPVNPISEPSPFPED